jgi:hypothetical protein
MGTEQDIFIRMAFGNENVGLWGVLVHIIAIITTAPPWHRVFCIAWPSTEESRTLARQRCAASPQRVFHFQTEDSPTIKTAYNNAEQTERRKHTTVPVKATHLVPKYSSNLVRPPSPNLKFPTICCPPSLCAEFCVSLSLERAALCGKARHAVVL